MFTGIIEEVGRVESIRAYTLKISCSKVTEDMNIGDSVAVNGVCLTVTEFGSAYFCADISEETKRRSSLKNIVTGSMVNLERAVKLGDRLGGHIVQGHVDSTGTVLEINKSGDFYNLRVEVPFNLRKYISEKGSVSIDGISLTVAEDLGTSISLAIIPHTFTSTALAYISCGSTVNIEVDVMARYLEKLINCGTNDNRLVQLITDMKR